jgi:2OG-Fe(II) oxygenase superfamily
VYQLTFHEKAASFGAQSLSSAYSALHLACEFRHLGKWIAVAEQMGFARSLENGGPWFAGKRQRASGFNAALAHTVFERIKHRLARRQHDDLGRAKEYSFAPQSVNVRGGTYVPTGVSPLLRFSRYEAGDALGWHVDTCTALDMQHVGLESVLVNLNDGFEGDETVIRDKESGVETVVTPETGMAFVFYHCQMHTGNPVVQGTKPTDLVRTEVTYTYEPLPRAGEAS